jgi:hypothetical protein
MVYYYNTSPTTHQLPIKEKENTLRTWLKMTPAKRYDTLTRKYMPEEAAADLFALVVFLSEGVTFKLP